VLPYVGWDVVGDGRACNDKGHLQCQEVRNLFFNILNSFELRGSDGVAVNVKGGFPGQGILIQGVLVAQNVFQCER
jgi:hypothetical protein